MEKWNAKILIPYYPFKKNKKIPYSTVEMNIKLWKLKIILKFSLI